VNILSFLALNVYPPTYTNELKDIAQFLGFSWSDKNASGILSIVWRKRWELSQDILYKRKLIQYNLEDCHALRLTKEWLSRIEETFSENGTTDLIFYQNHRPCSLPRPAVILYHFIPNEKEISPYSSSNSPYLDLILTHNFYSIPVVLSYFGSALQRERVS
jgi:hypothetical protein